MIRDQGLGILVPLVEGPEAEDALAQAEARWPEPEKRLIEQEPDEKLPSAGVKRRVLGTGLVLLASLLVLIGFVEFEPVAHAASTSV